MSSGYMKGTLDRVRAEFLEMPGLRLTVRQVQRLCGVDETICKGVLDALVDAKFLTSRPDGTYMRLTEGDHFPQPQPIRVDMIPRPDARQAS